MTRTVLTAPTGHGVGLTATSLGLVVALDRLGISVGFVKPVAQPRDSGEERSPALVASITGLRPPAPIAAERAEQLLGEGRLTELLEEVVGIAALVGDVDVLVVEGLVPTTDRVWSARLNTAVAQTLDADVLLVGDGSDVDATRIADSMAITATPYRSNESARIAGCVVNRLPDTTPERIAALEAALDRRGLRLAGAVGMRAELTWPRVGDVARELSARWLVEGDPSRRVAEVVVCAQAVPGLLPLLRDDRLLLVPGDRHDVVLAACLAALNGVRLAGLLLTAGVAPHPDVTSLTASAAATGLPIMLVDEATYPSALRVHTLNPEMRADDEVRTRTVATTVADGLDVGWLQSLPAPGQPRRMTPAAFRHTLVALARAASARIVLPEGAEPRTVAAAVACAQRGIARCLLLAPLEEVQATARRLGLSQIADGLPEGLEVADPAALVDRFADELTRLRAHKGMTRPVALERLADPITAATMLLHAGEVDGLVAGAVHTTAATVRPALEIIRAAPGASLVSSVFFMCLPDEVVAYADCAINPDPSADELADIAVATAASARMLGIEPRVAMISFSTGSSGSGSDVEKVTSATALVREREPDLVVDGPLQYDAASVPSVARAKRPGSPVAGRANVFVFPDLNTGNTTYKAVQRSADVVSIGPMLQGLARPVNDLSRGASVEDIVYTIALTAVQAAAAAPLDPVRRAPAPPAAAPAPGGRGDGERGRAPR